MTKSISFQRFKSWHQAGNAWIWLSASGIAISLILIGFVFLLIAGKGLRHFWPDDIQEIHYQTFCEQGEHAQQKHYFGNLISKQSRSSTYMKEAGVYLSDDSKEIEQQLIRQGGRDIHAQEFVWLCKKHISSMTQPNDLWLFERITGGPIFGRIKGLMINNVLIPYEGDIVPLQNEMKKIHEKRAIIDKIQLKDIFKINAKLESLRLEKRRLELKHQWNPTKEIEHQKKKSELTASYQMLEKELFAVRESISHNYLKVDLGNQKIFHLYLQDLVRYLDSNNSNFLDKTGYFFKRIWEFLSDYPREANTEGGVFPAIFGTVLMVLIMSILVTPLGVIVAVYMNEYARQNWATKMVRIAINNLAGVPSVIYGIFSLGFFVYFIGGQIDALFFPERLPSSTFGTPGLLWVSLTLAILTIPVVVVSTEEGLARVPMNIRSGSLALGATRSETLWRVVLPMAMPGIITGLILAIARASGEVAPLMLVGVVKLAPTLPINHVEPFIHLDQKIMHLGFHIFDVGFQSPNIDAARPLVYATALLLLLIVICLNLSAFALRNHLREKYRLLDN